MLSVSNPYPVKQLKMIAGTGGAKKGQLAVLSSGTAIAATEAVASAIILGVFAEAADATDMVMIDPIVPGGCIVADFYQGGSTDAITDAMLGTLYDLYVDGSTGEMYLDLNDTTGAFLFPIGRSDNGLKAYVKPLAAHIYLQ